MRKDEYTEIVYRLEISEVENLILRYLEEEDNRKIIGVANHIAVWFVDRENDGKPLNVQLAEVLVKYKREIEDAW